MNSFNEVSLYAIQFSKQKMIQTTSRWEHTQLLKHTGNEPQKPTCPTYLWRFKN